MISTLSILLFAVQIGSQTPPDLLAVEAPDARVARALERAAAELQTAEYDVAIRALAKTTIGHFAAARADLSQPAALTPFGLIALHVYWTASADSAFLEERWPDVVTAFDENASVDAGIWLATLDAALGLSAAIPDAAVKQRAVGWYETAERRLAAQRSIFGLAFGLYAAPRADTLLAEIMPYVRAVWPIANGLAALAHYEYHQDSVAFQLFESMLERNSFTAPMLLLPLVRGLIGWETDAPHRAAALEPHLPEQWESLTVSNLPLGNDRIAAALRRERSSYTIDLQRARPGRPLSLRIAPALPHGARVRSVMLNEHDVPIHVEQNNHDTHVVIEMTLRREAHIEIEYELPRKRASPKQEK